MAGKHRKTPKIKGKGIIARIENRIEKIRDRDEGGK